MCSKMSLWRKKVFEERWGTGVKKPDENIFYTHNKENSIHNAVCVSLFQQLLANKHHKLHDSKSS